MEERKIIILVLLALLLLPLANASISNYAVPSTIPLNQGITATGQSTNDSNNAVADELCSFYFLDSSGNLVDRASDQHTDQTGRFAMPAFVITEPKFQRFQNFTLKTVCGPNEEDANFTVDQRQELLPFVPLYKQGFAYDLLFWTDPENPLFLFYAIIILSVCVGIGLLIWKYYKPFWGC